MRWMGIVVGLLMAQDTLYLTVAEAERRFLEANLLLAAQKLRIQAEQARVWQARLWPNPQLAVGQMDFFTRQADPFGEGPWLQTPRANQITATLSQTLLTAGKRLKGVALAEAALRLQEAAFAELLRQLRYELRTTLYGLQRDQVLLALLAEQRSLLDRLRERYRRLSEQALVPLPEYLRIENLYLQVEADLRARRQSWEAGQHSLRQALRLEGFRGVIWVDTTGFQRLLKREDLPALDSLLAQIERRGDVRLARAAYQFAAADLSLQKALAIPDVDVQVEYDRLGSYRFNQLGVGFALPLPLFNRNQGNIAAARRTLEANELAYQQAVLAAQSEVLQAWRRYAFLIEQSQQLNPGLFDRYRQAEAAYRENLLAGRVSFLVYVDFFQSYRNLAENLSETFYQIHQVQNEMEFAVGMAP